MARILVNTSSAGGGGAGFLSVGDQIDSCAGVIDSLNDYESQWRDFAFSPINESRLVFGGVLTNDGFARTYLRAVPIEVDANGQLIRGTASNTYLSGWDGSTAYGCLSPGRPGQILFAYWMASSSGTGIHWGAAEIHVDGNWAISPGINYQTSSQNNNYPYIDNSRVPTPVGSNEVAVIGYNGSNYSCGSIATASSANWSGATGQQLSTYTSTGFMGGCYQHWTDTSARGAFFISRTAINQDTIYFTTGSAVGIGTVGYSNTLGFLRGSQFATAKYSGSTASEDRYLLMNNGRILSVDSSGTTKYTGFSPLAAGFSKEENKDYGSLTPLKKNVYIGMMGTPDGVRTAIIRVSCDVGATEEVTLELISVFEENADAKGAADRFIYFGQCTVMGANSEFLLTRRFNTVSTYDISNWNLASL